MIAGTSPREAAELLFGLLLDVARRHQPEIVPLLKGGAAVADFSPELMARALQAQGIWFQLLSIAEQNAAMRRRRQIERERGREELRGTFSHVLAEAARNGVDLSRLLAFVGGTEAVRPERCDVITMNILPEVIIPLLPEVSGWLHSGSSLIVSGIINSRRDEVIAAAAAESLRLRAEAASGEWWCGLLSRN